MTPKSFSWSTTSYWWLPKVYGLNKLNSSWIIWLSTASMISRDRFVSSANIYKIESSSITSSKSFIKMTKSIGPKTDHCWTPLVTSVQSDVTPLTTTLCLRHDKNDLIHSRGSPSMPYDFNFMRSRPCGTLSNAFMKSKYTTSMKPPCPVCWSIGPALSIAARLWSGLL